MFLHFYNFSPHRVSEGIFRSNTGQHISVSTPAPHGGVSTWCVTQQRKVQTLSFGNNYLLWNTPDTCKVKKGWKTLKAQIRHKAFLSGWTSDGLSSLCDQLPWRGDMRMFKKVNSMWQSFVTGWKTSNGTDLLNNREQRWCVWVKDFILQILNAWALALRSNFK